AAGVPADPRRLRRRTAETPQRPATVDEVAADARALAARGGHRHRVAHETGELDEAEDDDQEDRREEKRQLRRALSLVGARERSHCCGAWMSVQVRPAG